MNEVQEETKFSESLGSIILNLFLAALLSTVFLFVLLPPYAFFVLPFQITKLFTLEALFNLKIVFSSFLPSLIFLQTLAQTPAYFLIPYLRSLKPKKLGWKNLGLDSRDLPKQILLGVKIWLIVEVTALFYDFVIVKFGLSASGPGGHSFLANLSSFSLILMFISQGILGPLGEEVFFRGYAFQSLLGKYSFRKAAVLSSFLFAILHGLSWNLPILFIHGLLYAYFLSCSKSLISVITAHTLKNTITLLFGAFSVNLY